MRHTIIAFGIATLCSTSARAEDSTKTAVDGEASTTLNAVLEHVVETAPALTASKVPATAKGTLVIRRSDGGRPSIKGTLATGPVTAATYDTKTIDWDFGRSLGRFESERRAGGELERVVVTAEPELRRQRFTRSGGAVESQSLFELRTVQLKQGGRVPIVKTEDRVTVTPKGVAPFEASGQPRLLLQSGYAKTSGADGGTIYTRTTIRVDQQPVTAPELEQFLERRVRN